MKKSEIASWIVYGIMTVAAVIVSIFVISDVTNDFAPNTMHPALFVIINLAICIFFNVVMLEVLHILGALMGGYSVSYVNFWRIRFEKKEKGIALRFKDYDGLTGETKIVKKNENASLRPYVWFPLFGYAAELAGCIVLYSQFSKNPSGDYSWLTVSALIFIVISSMMAFYNLFPMKLDSTTDGYRMVLMASATNFEAYNEVLRVDELQRTGKEATEIKVFDDITEFTANINMFAVYNLLGEGNLVGAEEIIDKILKDTQKLEPYTLYHVICQKIYIVLMTKDVDAGKAVYDELADDKARRFIANDLAMESIRAYILISGLIEKSEGEVNFAIGRKPKAMKRAVKSKVEIEEKLYQDALNKVYEAHPKWKKEKAAE